MRFNSAELVEHSMKAADQEGRMTHKAPARTLYDSAYKERWFKLKGNLLFFYRLNEQGVVEKNKPHGVFVLENIMVERDEEDLSFLYGFTITWKDDAYKKHSFYTLSENILLTWITKLVKASYENLRAQLLVLRIKIEQKSGKDPLEHLGTPLPIRSLRGTWVAPSKSNPFTSSSSFLSHISPHPQLSSSCDLLLNSLGTNHNTPTPNSLHPNPLIVNSAPSTPASTPKFSTYPIDICADIPLPPPRRPKGKDLFKGPEERGKPLRPPRASFQCHIGTDACPKEKEGALGQKEVEQTFKSHVHLD